MAREKFDRSKPMPRYQTSLYKKAERET
nr:N-terminal region (11aa) of EF-Tu of M. pneumoniae [synthetic construct]